MAATGDAGPRRTCVGCRRIADPAELVRIARAPGGALTVGPGPGRGAWLCAGSEACFEAAVRRRALGRALRRHVTTDEIQCLREKLFEDKSETKSGD